MEAAEVRTKRISTRSGLAPAGMLDKTPEVAARHKAIDMHHTQEVHARAVAKRIVTLYRALERRQDANDEAFTRGWLRQYGVDENHLDFAYGLVWKTINKDLER